MLKHRHMSIEECPYTERELHTGVLEHERRPGDQYKGDFGTVTAVIFQGMMMYRVDFNDHTWQHFEDEEVAVDAVTDYSGAHRDC